VIGVAEIPNHRRDRHVHQRGVDDQDEHRHRQQEGQQPLMARCLVRSAATRRIAHLDTAVPAPVANPARCPQ
jgi:hypothetical protein